jgi:hypothetical protein
MAFRLEDDVDRNKSGDRMGINEPSSLVMLLQLIIAVRSLPEFNGKRAFFRCGLCVLFARVLISRLASLFSLSTGSSVLSVCLFVYFIVCLLFTVTLL